MVELWEKIAFKVGKHTLVYRVHPNFLLNTTTGCGHTNVEIFHLLGIEDPVAFADKVYGYPCKQPNKDSFPEYHMDDLAAATAIIDALKEKCEKTIDHDHLLKWGDNVYFRIGDRTITYKVNSTHLMNYDGSNSIIFDELGLDKYAVCTKCYGYDAGYGSFPTCHGEDFEALTRLIDYLQQKCKEYNAKYDDMPEDLKAKPGKIAPEYARCKSPWDDLPMAKIDTRPPTSSILSETTLLTRRKSNTCKF